MLVESFVASIESGEKSGKSSHKDAGIFLHEYQPFPAIKAIYKKSSTKPYCLAANASHVFAAQADKAVVNVYSIERGNQEAIVPFPERISSLCLVGEPEDAGILAMGNENGRLILWELYTGRQISTPAAHLQAVECIAVDPTYSYLLTGSPDSNIQVWSVTALLSFSSSASQDSSQPSPFVPIHTFSNHRAPITSIVMGHSLSSANIAISGSQDKSCIVWDYQSGHLLHTFLFKSAPLCLALDPADRAIYVGLSNGAIQVADFYKELALEHKIHDRRLTTAPTELAENDEWESPSDSPSQVRSIAISYDGTSLISGHDNGKIVQWDAGTGRASNAILSDLSAPVTNLLMRPLTGFKDTRTRTLKSISVVKPRYEKSLDRIGILESNAIPETYVCNAQLVSAMPLPRFSPSRETASQVSDQFDSLMSDFEEALNHSSLPTSNMEDGIFLTTTSGIPGDELKASYTSVEKSQKDMMEMQLRLSEAINACAKYHEQAKELDAELYRMQKGLREKERSKRMKRLKRAKAEQQQREIEMGETKENGEAVVEDDPESSTNTDEMTGSE